MLTRRLGHFREVAKFLNLAFRIEKLKTKYKNTACVNPKSNGLFSALLFIYEPLPNIKKNMKIQLIQFSDIHFKENDNSILEKKEQLVNAIRNEVLVENETILIITGDSAFSGSEKEFEISYNFYSEIIKEINEYNNCQIKLLVLPGNHDCQNLIQKDPVRQTLIDTVQKDYATAQLELIKNISQNLSNYSTFESLCNDDWDNIYSSELLKVYRLEKDGKSTIFYCYNTAFQSILNEIPGKMIFPLHLLDKKIFQQKADLKVSCFHHPLHWLTPENNRLFKNHIEQTSDFYLTGHEHIKSKSKTTDLEDNITYKVEGDVLQDSESTNESGFNLINIDLEKTRFQIHNYKWSGERYNESEKSSDWNSFERGAPKVNNPFQITNEFKESLNEIGANFSHPNVSKVKLSDVYVYPNLELLNQPEGNDESSASLSINSENILKSFKNDIRIIFSGTENIGKTSLLKNCFTILHLQGFVPLLIDGHKIKSTSIDDLKKLFLKTFFEQYTSTSPEDFNQLDKSKLVIIIDDFNRTKINLKYKAKLLQNLNTHFSNLIISGNELMSLEDIIIDENIEEDLYSSFSLFEIKEFGYQLKSKLINKWNILGVEHSISEEERIRKLQHSETVINTVTGINFVPSYPFFILTILQSIELGNPTDLSASTFGHYYQFLIQKSFTNVLSSQREITEYENYLSELSFYLYDNSLRDFDIHEFEKFDAQYRKDYTITHSLDRITQNLINAKILDNHSGLLEYKYSYVHYFFISNYLASHISEKRIKEIITSLTDSLYKTEYSNILMFLTHHSKDEFLLTELLTKSKSIFNDLAPCELQDDIKSINKLGEKIPELVFKSRSIDEYREEENLLKDEHLENNTKNKELPDPTEDEIDDEINIVAKLNTAFKSIEIVGQILKNNFGKIGNSTIEALIEETILLGLRTLNVFFSIIEENSEFVINQVNAVITELEKSRGKKVDNPKKIESLSKSTLFGLCNQISYSFIKKISDSIGTEYLNDILEKVYAKQDYNSVKLIKLAIKLDHYKGFPDSDIKKLKKELNNSHLPTQIMKRLVVNHLYLYPTNYTQKSKILSFLEIPIESQLRIDKVTKQRKK